jgi:hypothetical protein
MEVPGKRASRRRHFFWHGIAYYRVGLFALRSPEASTWPIIAAATMFALPLVVLLLPRTLMLFATANSNAAD